MPISSSKGKQGQKKQGQKYKNATAWQVNKHSFIAQKIASTPCIGMCQRCHEIIDWRKRMGKYKPLTQPKKCVECAQKTVTGAYLVMCLKCASAKQVCGKCLLPNEVVNGAEDVKSKVQLNQEKLEYEKALEKMSERQRRSFLRKQARGDEEGAAKLQQAALNKESDDEFDDLDFSSDEEEI